ncbi:hypothetical protein GCM10008955_29620 [Deinococcus malanensis]|uniref:Uncharacterized protein n=1 Tax=Deinococcus malanensis TaxID=1706855 RepID=A0ABQ2EZT7_9DEIO|nr:hypothetical protein [Deinococcus malanensis]GGK33641.1 hypothetical protein GCM10008955_29620 [Deinococcus malanensis]
MDYVLVKVQHDRDPGRGRVLQSECLAIDEGSTLRIVKFEASGGQPCHYELVDEVNGLTYRAECGTGEGRHDGIYVYRVQEPGFRA